jgi:serine/threonine protein phosphatase PrpC
MTEPHTTETDITPSPTPQSEILPADAPRGGPAASSCPSCGAPIGSGELFCEACGAEVTPAATLAEPAAVASVASGAAAGRAHDGTLLDDASVAGTDRARHNPFRVVDADLETLPPTCAACDGIVAADGYCEQCGAAAPRPRDHWVDRPAAWLTAVCDRGVRHTRNEDAVAVAAAQEPSSLGALVVCDGVSMAPGSDVASLAAARAGRDALIDGLGLRAPEGAPGAGAGPEAAARSTPQTSRGGEFTARMLAAGEAAQREAAASGAGVGDGKSPPSCTFVAALIERSSGIGPGLVVTGWVGDSRAYWVPDDGEPVQLSEDDSWASEAIAHGVPRAEAESMPRAHAITRWLGADAPDPVPRTRIHPLDRAGWLLLCSDGLWNYASGAEEIAELIHGARSAPAEDEAPAVDPVTVDPVAVDPEALAEALVDWAIDRGGHDNITVALARFDPTTPHDMEAR